MLTVFHSVLYASDVFVFWYFVALNAIYMILLGIAAKAMYEYNEERRIERGVALPPEFMKPFSVIMPAFNEELAIIDSVTALLQLDYPEFEVLVCNDGSTDKTLDLLKEHFTLEKVEVEKMDRYPCGPVKAVYFSRKDPKLVVIDKENRGKPDALNTAACFSRYPYICSVDADSLLARDSMTKLMHGFVAVPGSVAVGGVVRLANGAKLEKGQIRELGMPRNMVERIQIVEYFRAFLFGRVGFSRLNVLLIISGAFGVFRQDILEQIKGWNRKAIGEDMELVVHMQKLVSQTNNRLKIIFAPDPVCWTQAPSTLGLLSIQRDRWQRALTQCLTKNINMFFNLKYRNIGMIGYPYYFIFELLGAVIEFIGYPLVIMSFILGIIDLRFFLLFIAVALVWGLCISVTSLTLAELSYKRYPGRKALWQLLQAALYENFGYRQLHAYWRFKGMIRYIFGKKADWGEVHRYRFEHSHRNEGEH